MRGLPKLFLLVVMAVPTAAQAVEQPLSLEECLAAMQKIGPKGQGHRQAMKACGQLSRMPSQALPQILAGMNDDNPLANNWIRAAVESIAERTLVSRGQLPLEQLEGYLQDKSHSPRSRLLAFELIVRADPSAQNRLISQMMTDPSLEL